MEERFDCYVSLRYDAAHASDEKTEKDATL